MMILAPYTPRLAVPARVDLAVRNDLGEGNGGGAEEGGARHFSPTLSSHAPGRPRLADPQPADTEHPQSAPPPPALPHVPTRHQPPPPLALLHMEQVHAISPGRATGLVDLSACFPSPARGHVVTNGAAMSAATAADSLSAAVAAATAAATAVMGGEPAARLSSALVLRRDGDALVDAERRPAEVLTAVVLLRRRRLAEGEREREVLTLARPAEPDRELAPAPARLLGVRPLPGCDALLLLLLLLPPVTAKDAEAARVRRGTPRGFGGVGASARPAMTRVGVGGVEPRDDDREPGATSASLAIAESAAPPPSLP